mmetsp:Transcript_5807/g.18179  ORF Transcript_5807/g.18179 Transcript_5807/m.18179 type:complete len:89 (+) Transcript_5807:1-267(+)
MWLFPPTLRFSLSHSPLYSPPFPLSSASAARIPSGPPRRRVAAPSPSPPLPLPLSPHGGKNERERESKRARERERERECERTNEHVFY